MKEDKKEGDEGMMEEENPNGEKKEGDGMVEEN